MIWISGDCIGVMLEIPINYSRVGNLVEQLNSFLLAKYSAVSVKIIFGEEVCPEVVYAAREKRTSLWEAYNPRGSYSDGPPTTFAPRPSQCVKSLGL
jgi:hypothetical protein